MWHTNNRPQPHPVLPPPAFSGIGWLACILVIEPPAAVGGDSELSRVRVDRHEIDYGDEQTREHEWDCVFGGRMPQGHFFGAVLWYNCYCYCERLTGRQAPGSTPDKNSINLTNTD
ncbi:hypothetical protein M752DRAFT_100432 [Aspergillus phoenicis ATCC 13157]|uniref:Uncharacterized protein n=1 Tax=Aspergillus phoenicis ATCC 13157 TaxID=1353007 RepID=A0A370PVT7_ASPPH|nr:hypothetical protein M752DRAFT_100432 [Aspergillus phoenicis ATCC 13157]